MLSSKNAVFIGFLFTALVVVGVLGFVGVARYGEIEAVVERRWREEADAFLRDSLEKVRKDWEELEEAALGRAENDAGLGTEGVEEAEKALPRLQRMLGIKKRRFQFRLKRLKKK